MLFHLFGDGDKMIALAKFLEQNDYLLNLIYFGIMITCLTLLYMENISIYLNLLSILGIPKIISMFLLKLSIEISF